MGLTSWRKAVRIRVFRWALKNMRRAVRNPVAVFEGNLAIRHIVHQLRGKRQLSCGSDFDVRPPIIFVYGFKQSEFFPLYGFAAIETARRHHPGSPIFFIYVHEPFGKYWERIKSGLTLTQIPDFNYYGPAKFKHYAHKADVVRLLALRELGGIYFDIDTVCVKPFHALLKAEFTMGVQAACPNAAGGLCNATMVARPRSRFVKRWLRYYVGFHSKGHDQFWDFHSVKLPWLLAARYPQDIRVLPHNAFFFPLWHRLVEALFVPQSGRRFDLSETYSIHLWNNITRDTLNALDVKYLRGSPHCLYAEILGNDLIEQLSESQRGGFPPEPKVAARAVH